MKLTSEEIELLKTIEENHKLPLDTIALMLESSEEVGPQDHRKIRSR